MKKLFEFSHFKSDLLGGTTAGIVALPLALAFGEQSGLGAAAGLYGAAFIAFFAALFGGTNTQISGPTAPMTALSMLIVAGILQATEGNLKLALPIILSVFLLAGIFQIAMGMFKLGTFIKFIPYTVVSGFMTGIGVIILITQILPAMGYYTENDPNVLEKQIPQAEEILLERILVDEAEDGILVLEEFRETISRSEKITEDEIMREARILAKNQGKGVIGSLKFLPKAVAQINYIEFILAMLTIIIIYGFKRITSAIPSTLLALVLVSSAAYFLKLDYFPIDKIPTGLPTLNFGIFTEFNLSLMAPFIMSALMLAMLGAIDSLLTSVVADNLTRTQHNPNKELTGQGIGNMIAAFFGGIPGAGATIRTVVNIQAGGKTKLSGMTAGIFLFIILIFLGPVASQIPAAVLAGILITVGIGVIDYKGLRALKAMALPEIIILITVLVLTVFWQLVYAVGIGLILASLVFLQKMSEVSSESVLVNNLKLDGRRKMKWSDELTIDESIRGKVVFKHLNGPLFFGFASDFRTLISSLPDIHVLIIRMESVPFMDQSGIYALESAINQLHAQGVIVAISGITEAHQKTLSKLKVIPKVISERHIFTKFSDCRNWLIDVLKNDDSLKRELNLVS